MRVCIVTSYDLSRDGGVNRHVLGLRDALTALGDHVEVLGPASGSTPAGCHGLAGVVGVPANGSMAHIGLLGRAAETVDFFKQGRFDVAHVHEPIVPGPARHTVAWSGVPVVATFHSYARTESFLLRSARRMVSSPLRKLAHGIAVSEAAKRFATVIYGGPISVIPNGIVGSDFEPRPERAPTRDRPLRVLFAGRFGERRKGLRYLLLAATELKRRGHAVDVMVVGDGPREAFAALASQASVRFVGRVDDAALAEHYRQADLFCAPSIDGESFGLVLIEAMAAGCPVVASDIPGYAEAAAGCAVLVPPADPNALATALWHVGQDPAKQTSLRQRGQRRAASLDWRELTPQVRAIYAQAADLTKEAVALAGVGT